MNKTHFAQKVILRDLKFTLNGISKLCMYIVMNGNGNASVKLSAIITMKYHLLQSNRCFHGAIPPLVVQ